MKKILGCFVVSFLALAACKSDDNPSGQEVLDRSTPVICAKTQECQGAIFDIAYPGGLTECQSKLEAGVKSQRGDLDGQSVCSDDELTRCLDQFKAAACKADGNLPDFPCNC